MSKWSKTVKTDGRSYRVIYEPCPGAGTAPGRQFHSDPRTGEQIMRLLAGKD